MRPIPRILRVAILHDVTTGNERTGAGRERNDRLRVSGRFHAMDVATRMQMVAEPVFDESSLRQRNGFGRKQRPVADGALHLAPTRMYAGSTIVVLAREPELVVGRTP